MIKLPHAVLLSAFILLPSCASFRGLTTLNDMKDDEFIRYTARAVADVQAIATVAVSQGDLDDQELMTVQAVLRGIAAGSIALAGASLTDALRLDGYGALALTLAVTELDARFEERGAYGEGGILSERARQVLLAVATGLESLEAVAQPAD